MSYKVMKRYGLIFNAYCKVKEANLKRLHTVRFQLSGILEKEKKNKTMKTVKDQWLPRD